MTSKPTKTLDEIKELLKNKLPYWQFAENYFSLIESSGPLIKGKTESHHILPKSLFPEFKTSKWNLVNLSIENHIMAHYWLAKSGNYKMGYALSRMGVQIDKIPGQLDLKILKEINHLKHEAKASLDRSKYTIELFGAFDLSSGELVETFDYLPDAAKFLSIYKAGSAIKRCLLNERNHTFGYAWKYITYDEFGNPVTNIANLIAADLERTRARRKAASDARKKNNE